MDLLLVLLAAALFPVACLGFVLWMGRIEDTLPGAVRRATRNPDPLPVLALPVRRPPPALVIPAQRTDSSVPLTVVPEAAPVLAAPEQTAAEPTGT
jgi:hypothetical protein